MDVETLLIRTESSLSKFLDKQAIEVLQTLDPEAIRPSNLIELILKTIDAHTMLKDVHMRKVLISAMKENEAEEFAKLIGITKWNDVHYALLNKKFGKKELGKALMFFGKKIEDVESYDYSKEDKEDVSPEKPLFPHQINTVHKIRKKLSMEPYKALLHMPTGSGKTLCATRVVLMHLLRNPNDLVVWLAHNEELCEQAISEFKRTWSAAGDRKISTYRFFKRSKLNPLTIKSGFMSSSLSKMLGSAKKSNTFLSEMAKNTNLVVIDEAHQATAPKFSIIIKELSESSDTQLLGLSATPGRASQALSDANIKLANFFGKEKVPLDTGKENPIKFLTRNGYLAKAEFNKIPHDGSRLSKNDISKIEREIDVPKTILEKLSDDAKRNLSIVREIIRLSQKHKKIIVFAASVKHAKTISLILSAKRYTSHYITEATPSGLRSRVLDDYKNVDKPMILCNYGILTMGFDAPETSAVVIARPTKSYVLYAQMVGRGIRGSKAGGNKTCEISTVMDDDIDEFVNIEEIFTLWEEAWDE